MVRTLEQALDDIILEGVFILTSPEIETVDTFKEIFHQLMDDAPALWKKGEGAMVTRTSYHSLGMNAEFIRRRAYARARFGRRGDLLAESFEFSREAGDDQYSSQLMYSLFEGKMKSWDDASNVPKGLHYAIDASIGMIPLAEKVVAAYALVHPRFPRLAADCGENVLKRNRYLHAV